jgi:hypothetical protein
VVEAEVVVSPAAAGLFHLTGVASIAGCQRPALVDTVENMTAPFSVKPPQAPVKGFMAPPAGVPTLGLAEAAKACGVSVSTLRRKRPELEENGAAQTAKGWRIPVTALIALGLMDRTTDAHHEGRQDNPLTPAMTPPDDALMAQLDALRTALADAEQRAAVAEAVAAERERMIQTQAMALRMLEASKTPAAPTPTAPTEPAESPTPAPSKEDPKHAPKRAWWPFR